MKQKITNLVKLKDAVYLLSFKREFEFLPGQVISISKDGISPRLYSIASGNKEEEIKILFDVKHDGLLTPILSCLRKGDSIDISPPMGSFICTKIEKAYWIAAGTGIAPFASMFYSGYGINKTLVHGGGTRDSFYFEKDFSPILDLNYIRCCSRESGENVYNGRLTNFLREKDLLPVNIKYYLCGSAEMVVETRDILLSKNIPYKNILSEIYF
jgi:ferredoxin--NADP+ reductase